MGSRGIKKKDSEGGRTTFKEMFGTAPVMWGQGGERGETTISGHGCLLGFLRERAGVVAEATSAFEGSGGCRR